MYIRNISHLHEEMRSNEIMKLGFRSGKSLNHILPTDKMEIIKGDLKITRNQDGDRCITFIDCNEVECCSIITKMED